MNPHQYLSRIISQPLALDKARGRTLIRSLAHAVLKSERPSESIFGDPLPKMQIVGDIAYIPVTGVIDMDVPDVLKSFGFNLTDVNDICAEIKQALADPSVDRIVFPSNSPGGSGLAAEKLFDHIEAADKKKPCMGYIADAAMACSGMYWGLSACSFNYAGYYAEAIGNIGAYMVMLDDNEYWKDQGFDWLVLRDGEYKAIGEDQPNDEQLAYLQTIVTDCANLFRRNVKKKRSTIAAEDMRGQWFKGTEAAARGFVSGTAEDLNAAVSKFRRAT